MIFRGPKLPALSIISYKLGCIYTPQRVMHIAAS